MPRSVASCSRAPRSRTRSGQRHGPGCEKSEPARVQRLDCTRTVLPMMPEGPPRLPALTLPRRCGPASSLSQSDPLQGLRSPRAAGASVGRGAAAGPPRAGVPASARRRAPRPRPAGARTAADGRLFIESCRRRRETNCCSEANAQIMGVKPLIVSTPTATRFGRAWRVPTSLPYPAAGWPSSLGRSASGTAGNGTSRQEDGDHLLTHHPPPACGTPMGWRHCRVPSLCSPTVTRTES